MEKKHLKNERITTSFFVLVVIFNGSVGISSVRNVEGKEGNF